MLRLILVIYFISNGLLYSSEIILFKDNKINQAIERIAKWNIKQSNTAGMVILVQDSKGINYLNSFGYSIIKDQGRRLKKPPLLEVDAIFDLASLTKPLATTQGIMILIEDKKISLDDKVAKYIPEFDFADKKDITIYDLLTHTSGLKPWSPIYFHAKGKDNIIKYISSLPNFARRGEKQAYSDLNFIILGFIIEKVSGQSLDRYLWENLYKKLGMKDTMYNPPKSLQTRFVATSWDNEFERKMIDEGKYGVVEKSGDFKGWRNYTFIGEVDDGNAYYALGGVAGHAGLFSTAEDIGKLLKLMLNKGELNGISIYSKEVLEAFLKQQVFEKRINSTRALGFDYSKNYMGKTRPKDTFGHIGFTGTCFAINKEADLAIIILSNRENVGMNQDGGYASYNELCGKIMDEVYSYYGVSVIRNQTIVQP